MYQFSILLLLWTLSFPTGFVTYALPSTSDIRPRDLTPEDFPPNKTTDSKDIPLYSSAKYTSLVSLEAHIKDSNGVDITSSFQLKVFQQDASPHITNHTEEDNSFHDRRDLTMSNAVRIMNEDCKRGEKFVESRCRPNNRLAPMQAYEYTCRRVYPHYHALTGQYMGNMSTEKTRYTLCAPQELCVDGFGSEPIANCVHKNVFSDHFMDKRGQVIGMLDGEVFDAKKMYLVMALQKNADPAVRIKAEKMGMTLSNGATNGNGGMAQSESCVNCVNLETDLLQPGLDSLKIEATLTAAAGISGILWLAMG